MAKRRPWDAGYTAGSDRSGHGCVEVAATLAELDGLLGETDRDGFLGVETVFGGEVADLVADLHGTELGAAHGAEVGGLGGRSGQGLVVERPGLVGVEG